MGHVTLTMGNMGWSVILKLGYDTVYPSTKCDNSSFSHFRDITGGPKI